MRRSLALAAASALALVALPVAAQDASSDPSTQPSASAMVRVLHASPDAPAVDVHLDGMMVGAPLAGLEFGAISPYVEIPAGPHAVRVCATADASVCPIDVPELVLQPGMRYTVAATNVLASIEAQVIVDDAVADPARALVRFVHLSADAPAVDVLTQDGTVAVVSGLAYPDATAYLALDPGSYDLKVCATGDASVCPIDPPAVDLSAGQVLSVFAIGSLTGGTITAVIAADVEPTPAESPIPSPAM
ncbi:MAG: DUF4397 domain-containing protein [Chloroflexi bacterium]|nr:DUF4397 domain-containing protein [Chloroflexota bacterium]